MSEQTIIQPKPYRKAVTEVIDQRDLPQELRWKIYDDYIEDSSSILCMCDGDFEAKVDFERDSFEWMDELKSMLAPEVIERNQLAISFYQ